MASSRNSKTSGLRILWIPGSRKHRHGPNQSTSKGRYDATNKQVPYQSHQKKNQPWSLGGPKGQKDLLESSPETSLLDGPSAVTSSVTAPLSCALGAAASSSAAAQCSVETSEVSAITATTPPPTPTPTLTTTNSEDPKPDSESPITPQTPNSTTSTAPLVSPEEPQPPAATTSAANAAMPSKTTQPPVLVTTTIAEIIDDHNRFSILSKVRENGDNAALDLDDLPSPPKEKLSSGTSSSTVSANSPSTSPGKALNGHEGAGERIDEKGGGGGGTHQKKSPHRRNHNNNHQGDVNSIESISEEDSLKLKPPPLSTDLDWIDELTRDHKLREAQKQLQSDVDQPEHKDKEKSKHKKKHKRSRSRELDQLDGVPIKPSAVEDHPPEDEKVVKCLYYTLMCCDCTIS